LTTAGTATLLDHVIRRLGYMVWTPGLYLRPGFYIVLGVFVFLLSCFQAIHDYVTLDMYKLTVLPTDNGTDHCGMSTALV